MHQPASLMCQLRLALLTKTKARNDVQAILNGDLHKALAVCHDQLGILCGCGIHRIKMYTEHLF